MFETPLKVNYIPENFKNVIKLCFSRSIAPKTTDYDGVQSEYLIFGYRCKGMIKFIRII